MLLVVILTAGCGLERLGTYKPLPSSYAFDGVKLLTPAKGSDDTSTWSQASYLVSPTSHVLLRFESLSSHTGDIDTSAGKTVDVQLSLADAGQMVLALSELKLCPVTRSWMMLATWELAHPFLGGEKWATAGGDYDAGGCVLGTQVSGSTSAIKYNMTSWYRDYPKGRATNFGLLAIANQTINIVGEQSGGAYPRISFEEY